MTHRIAVALIVCSVSVGCAERNATPSAPTPTLPAREPATVGGSGPPLRPQVAESATVYNHTCVVQSGEVWCWGHNASRQLGMPGGAAWAFPLRVPGINDATQVSAGLSHTCAARASGSVVCWGSNAFGQLGNGNTEPWRGPTSVAGIDDAIQVSAAAGETCALHRNGQVSCWGDTRCMLETDPHCEPEHRTPRRITSLSQVVQVEVLGCLSGDEHLGAHYHNFPFALDAAGRVWTFGHANAPRALDWEKPVARLGGGCNMSAIFQDGSVQLAQARYRDSRAEDTPAPRAPEKLQGMTHLAGDCGIVDGRVRCWQVDGEQLVVQEPIAGDARELIAGTDCSCVRRKTGALECWGRNLRGACGVGATAWTQAPHHVAGISDVAEIAVGGFASCARKQSGEVLCWGSARVATGPVADGPGGPEFRSQPEPIGISDALAITVDASGGCAIVEGGQVTCWGAAGANTPEQLPRRELALGPASHLDLAWDRLCVSGSRGMRCQNRYGSEAISTLLPTHGLDQLVVGRYFACHKSRFGPLACTGASFAQKPRFKHFAADQYRLCGVAFPGVRCFRRPATERSARFEPDGNFKIPGAERITLGGNFGCVLLGDGSVQCWGDNSMGQLGVGHRLPSDLPITVTGLPGKVQQIAAAHYHICALMADGEVQCWGDNSAGQLGFDPRVAQPRRVDFEEHPELASYREQMAKEDQAYLADVRLKRDQQAQRDKQAREKQAQRDKQAHSAASRPSETGKKVETGDPPHESDREDLERVKK